MSVKAKFSCNSIIDTNYGGENPQRVVYLTAVYGTEGENADYSKVTPWGEIKMQIDKGTSAYEAFSPGKIYYLTFDAAE